MKLPILIAAAAMALTGAAFAEGAKAPTMMTDAQMDQVVAGIHLFIFAVGNENYRSEGASREPGKVAVRRATPAGFVCVSIGGDGTCGH